MNLPFESLSSESRIWIYQSDSAFSDADQEAMSFQIEQFLLSWSSHGNEIVSGFTFKHQRFIIIAIDESLTGASGCSIDKLVHFMQNLGNHFQLNLIDRSIAYVENEEIKICQFSQIKNLVNEGVINQDTPIFNTFVTTKAELNGKWLVKASETWTAKYFKLEIELV